MAEVMDYLSFSQFYREAQNSEDTHVCVFLSKMDFNDKNSWIGKVVNKNKIIMEVIQIKIIIYSRKGNDDEGFELIVGLSDRKLSTFLETICTALDSDDPFGMKNAKATPPAARRVKTQPKKCREHVPVGTQG